MSARILAIVAAVIAAPFIFALWVTGLYELALALGWGQQNAEGFAAFVTIMTVGGAAAIAICRVGLMLRIEKEEIDQ